METCLVLLSSPLGLFDVNRLQTGFQPKRIRAAGRIAVVVLMLGLWLGLMGLAASPQLHQLLHADSHQVSHECIAKLFASGQLLAPPAAVTVVIAVFLCLGRPILACSSILPISDVRLQASRAPPVVSHLQ